MNKGIVKKISILGLAVAISGCSGMATQHAAERMDQPILSASEAQSMIRVTVRPPVAVTDQDTIVAAND